MPHYVFAEERMFLTLTQAYSQCRKIAERRLSPLQVTLSEYSLLRILENTPKTTASQARKKLSTTAPTIAALVQSLQKKGLIERMADEKDSRKQPLVLTLKGTHVSAHARTVMRELLEALAIPDRVLRSLIESLSLLSTSLSSYGD